MAREFGQLQTEVVLSRLKTLSPTVWVENVSFCREDYTGDRLMCRTIFAVVGDLNVTCGYRNRSCKRSFACLFTQFITGDLADGQAINHQ